jgi:gluconokinase
MYYLASRRPLVQHLAGRTTNAKRVLTLDHGMRMIRQVKVVVMGVTGSGKSTVGALLAERLRVPYADADSFHGAANLAKMASGTPLTDEDRWPWLEAIGVWLGAHGRSGCVATCSVLKRRYRDALREHVPDAWFLFLDGSPGVVASRVAARRDHFMPVSLVESQFADLERPEIDERAVTVDLSKPPDQIVSEFLARIDDHPHGA